MTPLDIKATSGLYWASTLIVALIDVGSVLLLAWRVRPARFRQLTWVLAGASAILWGISATALPWGLWDLYYCHFYPGWACWLAPLDALLYGALGLALWWLALRLPGNPVVNFCLLGGLESVPEHLLGIYGLGILDKAPLLEGVSRLAGRSIARLKEQSPLRGLGFSP
ncbi:MAG: hypothetical protein ACE5OS_04100 [Anaerolineae bacterium]